VLRCAAASAVATATSNHRDRARIVQGAGAPASSTGMAGRQEPYSQV
jgi:hypothetical protein